MLVSTRDISQTTVSYTDALLSGLARDGGLYTMLSYPRISDTMLQSLRHSSYQEVVYKIKRQFVKETIPSHIFKTCIKNAYSRKNFSSKKGIITLDRLDKSFILENLSLGPTFSFKDIALFLLAQEVKYVINTKNKTLILLGATSGDTGSSSEAAFKGIKSIYLYMLSPEKGMSRFQHAQMAQLSGGNIINISVNGRFDDCQDLVKSLKQKKEFSMLGAVNSINWGRITSQVPYYFYGYLQIVKKIGDEVDFVVPTGNFGNVFSGYIAKMMGLPIRRLIIATNENDVLTRLIHTGIYKRKKACVTSSPSMDISKASNYERLVFDLFKKSAKVCIQYMEEFEKYGEVDIKRYGLSNNIFSKLGFYAESSTHLNRIKTIQDVYRRYQIIIDPHTADAFYIGRKFALHDGVPMIIMQTALPVKFESTIYDALGFVPKRNKNLKNFELNYSRKKFICIENDIRMLEKIMRKGIATCKNIYNIN